MNFFFNAAMALASAMLALLVFTGPNKVPGLLSLAACLWFVFAALYALDHE